MPSARPSSERQRGEIETLASGSLRVKVYAGIDPLSGKRHYRTETVPAGPRALAEAKKLRTRLIGQVDEQRNPRTRATVDQLMDRYLEVLDVEVTTRARYEVTIRRHVRPLLGHLPVAKLTGETIDTFNGVLRRCREHCDGRPFIEHGGGALRPGEVHDCTAKCRPHTPCRHTRESPTGLRPGCMPAITEPSSPLESSSCNAPSASGMTIIAGLLLHRRQAVDEHPRPQDGLGVDLPMIRSRARADRVDVVVVGRRRKEPSLGKSTTAPRPAGPFGAGSRPRPRVAMRAASTA